jgi:MSHA pilin protein MshC
MQIEKIVRERRRKDKGFTLIEVIAVLVLIAIISAVVISRGMDTEAVKVQAEVDTLKAHLRYSQYLAMNDISPVKWGIQISGQSYTLVRNSSGDGSTFDSPYSFPGDSGSTHGIAPFTATAVNILFDEWGTPYNSSAKLAADATVALNPGSQSITIKPETGFIP